MKKGKRFLFICIVSGVGVSLSRDEPDSSRTRASESVPRDMSTVLLCLFLLQLAQSESVVSNKTGDILDMFLHYDDSGTSYSATNSCSLRLHSSLDKLRKRQTPVTSGFIDLSGYALHQTLRRAPFDMYVTDIRVRTSGTGNWVRVEKCQFSNAENRLVAQIQFNDLAVTGNVRLFEENSLLKIPNHQVPAEFCSMTVRLKRAGLGINAFPTRGRSKGIDVRTEARFFDPNYLSIHAYGCKLNQIVNRNDNRRVSEDTGRVSHRYLETQIQQNSRLKKLIEDIRKGYQSDEDGDLEDRVRIITLSPNVPGTDDSLSSVQLHREDEAEINNYHKERILSAKFQNERDRLKAVLHVKNLIAQQANQVFQAHGPFSNFQTPVRRPVPEESFQDRPQTVHLAPGFVSTITELDENLRPVQAGPQESFFKPVNDKIVNVNGPGGETSVEEISREMEDMFLRGIKTLLTKYMEKQLELPLKEALMVSIGYTVSYG